MLGSNAGHAPPCGATVAEWLSLSETEIFYLWWCWCGLGLIGLVWAGSEFVHADTVGAS